MKKVLIGLGVLIVIFLVVFFNLRSSSKKVPKVRVEVLRIGPIRETVRAEGTVKAKNQVDIGADVTGRIVKLPVEEGDWVKKGDTLCLIDPSTYRARVQQARSRLLADLSRLKKLEADLKRVRELRKKGLVSESSLEEALSNFQSTKAQVLADSFALEEALEDLKKTVILSPIDGEVVALYKEEGEMVVVGTVNTPGSVIMVVADRSKMLVSALVDETEVVRIERGQKVRVSVDAFPDSVFMGRVLRIGGMPEKSSTLGQTEGVSYPVEIELVGGNSLFPGMSAVADIIVAEKDSAILLPFSAVGSKLVEGKRRDIVFVVREGVVHMTPVELGISSERYVEAVSGVKVEDTVVVGPFKVLKTLEDGDRVQIEKRRRFGRGANLRKGPA
jgi:HlyD family secretion protein